MSATRTLTSRELTLSFFGRQLLHRGRPLPAAQAVRQLAALQAQYSPSPYIALFSRLPGFSRDELEAALAKGTVVKSTLMRGTLHLVARGDYGSLAAAWRGQWLSDLRGRHHDAELDEEALLRSLTAFTARPRTAQELRDHVSEVSGGRVRPGDLVHYARALVPLVHVPPSGSWRAHGKPAMTRWVGPLEPEPEATTLLVRRYLRSFGPASRTDIAHFSYLKLRQIDRALAELAPLRRYVDEGGRELVDLPGNPAVPRSDSRLPVRFLPKWDAALLSHDDRTRILPAALHRQVYKAVNGELLATYLIDGQVAGTWEHHRAGDMATLTLTALTPATHRADIVEEGQRLLAFLEPEASRYDVLVVTADQ